jgi:hypothetical protein
LKKEFLDWKRKNGKSKKRRPSEKGKEVDTQPLFREGTVETDLQSDFTLFPEDSLESDGVVGSLFPEVEPEVEEGHEDKEKEDHGDNGDNDQDGDEDGDEGDSQITAPFESLVSWMYQLKVSTTNGSRFATVPCTSPILHLSSFFTHPHNSLILLLRNHRTQTRIDSKALQKLCTSTQRRTSLDGNVFTSLTRSPRCECPLSHSGYGSQSIIEILQ